MHYQARKPGTAGLKLSSVDNAARQSQTNDRDNDVLAQSHFSGIAPDASRVNHTKPIPAFMCTGKETRTSTLGSQEPDLRH